MSTVQKWEKCLTLVSELTDEWLETQRKWMYLEGIFIGGDIREQLPAEAEKFDSIDKSFRRVTLRWFEHGVIQKIIKLFINFLASF